MTEMFIFPNLPDAIKPWLTQRLLDLNMKTRVEVIRPTPMATRLVLLTAAGGTRLDITRQQVRLLIECYDATSAGYLAAMCSAVLEAATRQQEPIAPGVWINGSPDDFSVPVLFPDPTSTSPRYQFTANLILTGSAT